MCNGYRNRKSARRLVEAFSEIKLPLRFSNGIPNIEPRDDIKITERAPIIVPDGDGARLEMMRWSWPSPKGAPVFNFRSENRTFERAKRCLIPADGFYEFTPASDPSAAQCFIVQAEAVARAVQILDGRSCSATGAAALRHFLSSELHH